MTFTMTETNQIFNKFCRKLSPVLLPATSSFLESHVSDDPSNFSDRPVKNASSSTSYHKTDSDNSEQNKEELPEENNQKSSALSFTLGWASLAGNAEKNESKCIDEVTWKNSYLASWLIHTDYGFS